MDGYCRYTQMYVRVVVCVKLHYNPESYMKTSWLRSGFYLFATILAGLDSGVRLEPRQPLITHVLAHVAGNQDAMPEKKSPKG